MESQGPYKGEAERVKRRCDNKSRGWSDVKAGKGPGAKERRHPLEVDKCKEADSPSEPFIRNQPC